MKRKMTLLVLALTLVLTALADRSAEAYCQSYGSCEHSCMPMEEACMAGSVFPECGGNYDCCSSRVSRCYQCCIWY